MGSPQDPETQRKTQAINTKPGYLGFTSFSRVYEETQNSLSLLQGLDDTPSSSAAATYDISSPDDVRGENHSRTLASRWIREMCLTVLRNLPEEAQGGHLFRLPFGTMEHWPSIVARRVLASFYAEFGRHLGRRWDNTAQLEEIARRLCAGTSRPFSDEETDPDVWVGQLCGANLRWESVGLLFSFWDLSTNPKYSLAPMKDRLGRKGWAPLARECFNLCCDLCREFSPGNSVMLHLAW